MKTICGSRIGLIVAGLFATGAVALLAVQALRLFEHSPSETAADIAHVGSAPAGRRELQPVEAPPSVPAEQAVHLRGDEAVVGIATAGVAQAYPLRLLAVTEHLNDTVGTRPVCISWCPLTGSAVVFDRRINGETLTFRFNRGLYNGNLLLDDIESNSVWNQLAGTSVRGPHKGERLDVIPSMVTTWRHWRARHPETFAVDLAPGQGRRYRFPSARRNPAKGRPPAEFERVLGVTSGDLARAYPFETLAATATPLVETIGGETIQIHFEKTAPAAWATNTSGHLQPAVTVYWSAWKRFHPATTLFASTPPTASPPSAEAKP